jgi:threonine-phosphate decarboxylase
MLRAGLEGLGLSVLPSPLPFFLVRVGDGARVRAALLQHGCLVRDCASFGLPAYVRVAPRHPEQNLQLIDVWNELCRRP